MLDESATQNQLLDRASTIAHETAHMWFGDLVTMRWFNDVWMKEVFANFMAGEDREPVVSAGEPRAAVSARATIRRPTRSIARPARTRSGSRWRTSTTPASCTAPIIYQKAPIVMRQLETDRRRDRVPRRPARVSEDATRSATPPGSIWFGSSTRGRRRTSPPGAARGSRSAAGPSSRRRCGWMRGSAVGD